MAPAETRMAQWLEGAWLARYLDRQLSDGECAWFEAYVLDKPEILSAIDGDTQLRDALAASNRDEGEEAAAATYPVALRRSLPHAAGRWAALAASLLLGIGLATVGTYRPREPVASGSLQLRLPSPSRGLPTQKEPTIIGDKTSDHVLVDVEIPRGSTSVLVHLGGGREIHLSEVNGIATFVIDRAWITRPDVQVTYDDPEGKHHELSIAAAYISASKDFDRREP